MSELPVEGVQLPVPAAPVMAPHPVKPREDQRHPAPPPDTTPRAPRPGKIIDTYAKDAS